MTKVYPNGPVVEAPSPSELTAWAKGVREEVMTVWQKSLVFNCEGFTVFDGKGDLRFRVDSYSAGRKGEVVLMDAAGKSLFTIRRKRLSVGENWLIYDREETDHPVFSVKKHVTLLRSKCLAHVTPCRLRSPNSSYSIEGSHSQRQYAVYDSSTGRTVAEVRRKEAAAAGVTLGGDVFRLAVRPGLDLPLAMAMVIALEQMYGS